MKQKERKLIGISPEYREALSIIVGSKQYPKLVRFLQIQDNNIALFEWARIHSSDPDIARKKAYYEGQHDFIKAFLAILESCAKEKEDE